MSKRLLIDLIGQKFGMLTVFRIGSQDRAGRRVWLCRCDCGSTVGAYTGSLVYGRTKSCGCDRPKKPLTGRKVKGDFEGLCCIKGCDREVQGHDFCRSHYQAWRQNGHPLHFLKRRVASTSAKSATKEYKTWHGAKQRCTKPASRQWPHYGGRGIKMCERWIESFDNFLKDMGKVPTRSHSLERIDVNGNYEPSNCKWATATEQSRNTRAVRLTPAIVAEAKRRHLNGEIPAEMAREYGVPLVTLWQALRGKSWVDIAPAGSA
jgi:hypothetical protein